MKSGLWFLLSVTLLFGVLAIGASVAGAAELQLAGVRLDSPIMDLLSNPSWGEPEGIGPIAGGGAKPVSSASSGTAATGASRGGGGRAGRPSGMGGGATRGRGGGRGGGRAGAGGAAGSSQKSGSRGGTGMQYWLYRRPSGVEVILGVEPSGAISMIDVQGALDFTIYTSRGIGLGDTYSDLVNAYGYPDLTQGAGQGLIISYPEQNVKFTLGNLRITQITIGERPAPSARGATSRQRATSPSTRRGTGASRQRGGQSSRGFGGAGRGRARARPRGRQ